MIILQDAELCAEVRKNEEILVATAGEQITPFFRQIDLVILFLDRIEQLVVDLVHTSRLVAQIFYFGLLNQRLVRWIGQHLHQTRVFGKSTIGAQQQNSSFLLFRIGNQPFGLGNNLRNEALLRVDQPLDARLHFIEPLIFTRSRTADNQGGTGFIDQHRVNFVDDGIVVLTMNKINLVNHHIIAKIVETKLVVCPIRNVAAVFLPALK